MSQNIMNAISLVAVDLDGTLLTRAGILAPQSATLLTRAAQRGVHVILATTRLPESVQAFCRQLDLHHPFICLNGAQIWGTPEGPVWASSCIPQEVALVIAQVADTHNWDLSITIGTMRYRRARPGQALGQVGPNRVLVSTNAEAIVGEPGRILIQQPEAIEPLHALCHSKFSRECHTETYSDAAGVARELGIFARHADKGTALAFVLDRLAVNRQHVLVIGDNLNDLPMFPYAMVRVAMGNAPEAVKQQASMIAPSNDEEGVAWVLEAVGLAQGEAPT
jgi:Cof subfamily protein (haloacid dehalogenase superfamily)